MKTQKPPKLKIVSSSSLEERSNHREDFESCPHCDKKFENSTWDCQAYLLILNPAFFKASSVSVMSECPACFEKSWVHHRINSFGFSEWPQPWIDAVKKLEDEKKLKALRDWGASLCAKCANLTSGNVDFHAWRYCSIGSGPAETECDHFTPLP